MSDSPRTASDYFGAMGFEYDSLIHRSVPCYDAMIGKLIKYLPRHSQTVLELGCGSGGLSVPLVRHVPDCEFTFVDASEELVELTRARVQEDFPETARRATFVTARFEEYSMGVTSSISSRRRLACITWTIRAPYFVVCVNRSNREARFDLLINSVVGPRRTMHGCGKVCLTSSERQVTVRMRRFRVS